MRAPLWFTVTLLAAGPVNAGTPFRLDLGNVKSFPRPTAGVSTGPDSYITLMSSNPATECAGADLTTDQGGAVTFTRALAAYCEKADGSLVLVATGKPRISNKGMLIEGQRTNLCIRNMEFEHAAWTKNDCAVTANQGVDPAGGSAADLIDPDDGTESTALIISTAFVPSQTTGTASVYVKAESAVTQQDASLTIYDTTAGAVRGSCTVALTTSWQRIVCSGAGQTGANNHVLHITPDVSGDGESNVLVWGAQYEALLGNFATSVIPTAGASVQRPNDVATFVNGTDISTAGCLKADVSFLNPTISSTAGLISNGVERMMGYTSATVMQMNDGTNTTSATVASVLGRTISIRTAWSGVVTALTADGVSQAGTFDGFSSTATLRLGATAAASGYGYAYLDNVRVGSSASGCQL